MTGARIDVHQHYLPDAYVDALESAGKSPPDGMPSTPAWSEAAALVAMNQLGIAKAMCRYRHPAFISETTAPPTRWHAP